MSGVEGVIFELWFVICCVGWVDGDDPSHELFLELSLPLRNPQPSAARKVRHMMRAGCRLQNQQLGGEKVPDMELVTEI
jgi:hypothetical protein